MPVSILVTEGCGNWVAIEVLSRALASGGRLAGYPLRYAKKEGANWACCDAEIGYISRLDGSSERIRTRTRAREGRNRAVAQLAGPRAPRDPQMASQPAR